MQRDLNGVSLTAGQLSLISIAAVNACDVAGAQHMGYVDNPAQCHYDPNAGDRLHKIWCGETPDGSVPSPAMDNGFGIAPATNQRWFGLKRGSSLTNVAGLTPPTIATDFVALEFKKPVLATHAFINATGNGANGWTLLSYARSVRAARVSARPR